LVFCICVIFATTGISEVRSVAYTHDQAQADDPLLKIAGWIKRLFVTAKPTNCPVAEVDELTLDKTELITLCDNDERSCQNENDRIKVATTVKNYNEDSLIYLYKVSGGNVIGKGARVVWDLSNVAPGDYTIIAGVDDGCGVCGRTQTRTVKVTTNPVSR
jgi:hypothetical protein